MNDGKKKRGGEHDDESRSARAKRLLVRAREQHDPRRRATLARQALRLDPDHVDAYLLLAGEADDPISRAGLYRQALDAAERVLAARTLPELRATPGASAELAARDQARFALGRAFEDLGLLHEAAAHFRVALRDDPTDTAHVRFHQAAVLFELTLQGADGRPREELDALLRRFDADTSAWWSYDRALFSFREDRDDEGARQTLKAALAANPLVAPLLLAPPGIASAAPASAAEREARNYAQARRELWHAVAGATAWLASVAGAPAPAAQPLSDPDVPDELRLLDEVLSRLEPDVAQRLSPPERDVLALLEREIDGEWPPLKRYACGLWVAFAHSQRPQIRKPAVHAAATEYVTAQLLNLAELTQKELSRRYAVSASSVSRAAQAVDLWLDAALVDGLDVDGDELAEQLAEELVEELVGELGVELDEETLGELQALPVVDEEWQGALRRAPFQVLEPKPHRPMLAMWYEQQGGSILGQEIFGATAPPQALLHTCVQAMFSPLAGAPRRPRVLRVEDSAVAEQLRRQVGPAGIEVRHGALEGIASLMASLEQFMVQHSAVSYLEEGIEPSVVGRFFGAAAHLRRASPWSFVGAGQVLGIDLERWGERRLCVSVIGREGDERGLLIFHELDEYLRYFRHAEMSAVDGALVGAPVEMLSLVYEAGAELDIRQRREVFKHGWEVVGTDDYPMLYRFDADGGVQPLEPADYRIATVCAEAVAVYCAAHRAVFDGANRPPRRELVRLQHCDILDTVCVIAPHP